MFVILAQVSVYLEWEKTSAGSQCNKTRVQKAKWLNTMKGNYYSQTTGLCIENPKLPTENLLKLISELHKISRYKVNFKIKFSITFKKSDL